MRSEPDILAVLYKLVCYVTLVKAKLAFRFLIGSRLGERGGVGQQPNNYYEVVNHVQFPVQTSWGTINFGREEAHLAAKQS